MTTLTITSCDSSLHASHILEEVLVKSVANMSGSTSPPRQERGGADAMHHRDTNKCSAGKVGGGQAGGTAFPPMPMQVLHLTARANEVSHAHVHVCIFVWGLTQKSRIVMYTF